MNETYWKKQTKEKPLYPDLEWNRPEQKTGCLTIIGGNSSGFSGLNTAVATALELPLKTVKAFLPDSLKPKLPPSDYLSFASSTPSGGFASSALNILLEHADESTLIIGDLGKNSETAIAITNLVETLEGSITLTRDAVDLVTPDIEKIIEKGNLALLTTLPQLQKLFRTLYYPKVILLSQPLTALLETLHKFTITYETTIITFHQTQIIVASAGEITTTPLSSTPYSPFTLWSGELAAKIAANRLWTPNKPLESATAALL